MQMSVLVAVAGASGYAGGEVLRLLLNHPDVEIGTLAANSSAGQGVTSVHPHLLPLSGRVFSGTDAKELAGHDVVVLALPHGASARVSAEIEAANPEVTIIDCGADHRLLDGDAWRHFYGGEHAEPWAYGIPELLVRNGQEITKQRENLRGATRIAAPGCNASAVTLALAPAVTAGIIDTERINAVLSVGYSGAGRTLKPNLLAAEALGQIAPYTVGGTHRHIPEIEQNLLAAGARSLAQRVRLSFTPVLVPTSRGILAVVTAPLVPGTSDTTVREAWVAAYSNEPFIDLLAPGKWPTTKAVTGANVAQVGVGVDERAGVLTAVCALDNLVKGTAGAVVQCMNIALGLRESAGLPQIGLAP